MPLDDPMLATTVLLLPQVPPPVALVSVADKPWQIAGGPVILAGSEFTVIVFTTKHPVESE